MTTPIRINKRIAELGLASRREADTLIAEGVVFVDGKKATLGDKVSDSATIEIRKDTKSEKRYFAYYKGRGVITHSPGAGETDIAMMLKKQHKLEGVYPIGRLDKDSEGLLILTNDGRLTAPLLDSENAIEKTYEVEVDKDITATFLRQLANGVNIEGYRTKPASTTRKSAEQKRRFLITLTEGKKHQIRRMCAALGYQVQSLKRLQIATIELGKLKPNQYRKIEGAELKALFAATGIKMNAK